MVKVIWHKTASPPQTNGSIDLPGGANVPKKEATLASPGEYDWTCASFSTPESTAQTANRSVQPFLHHSRQKVPILYNGGPSPKLPLLVGGIGTPIYFMISWGRPSPQSKLHHDRFSYFRTDDRKCPYTLQCAPLSPKIAPSHGGIGPHVRHDSLDPSEPTDQMASLSVQPFLHRWLQSVPILYNGTPLTPQNCLFPWGDLNSHLICGSLGPTKSSTQMASRSVQPF